MIFGPYLYLIIPGIILAMWAQYKVSSEYSRYSDVLTKKGYTGTEVARMILDRHGLNNIEIQGIEGNLTDHYNPRTKTMGLSSGVYNSSSVAAVSIAAHESGHVIQDAESYSLLKFRNRMGIPVTFASNLALPLVIVGLVLGASLQFENPFLSGIAIAGIFMFALVVLFHLVTLPVELDASRRAIKELVAMGIITEDEKRGSKKVLSAAAMTYIAALTVAILNLIRIILIFTDRR